MEPDMGLFAPVHEQMDPSMAEFAISIGISLFLVLCSVAIFFEIMRIVWRHIHHISHKPRLAIYVGISAVFLCHSLCVLLYGVTYWVLIEEFALGGVLGQLNRGNLLSYIYFSATTYSSLGYGDIFPYGPMRLLVGVESINGLILIGWSVTYSYFATERYLNYEEKDEKPAHKK